MSLKPMRERNKEREKEREVTWMLSIRQIRGNQALAFSKTIQSLLVFVFVLGFVWGFFSTKGSRPL